MGEGREKYKVSLEETGAYGRGVPFAPMQWADKEKCGEERKGNESREPEYLGGAKRNGK